MSETWQNEAVKALEKIKSLSEQALITLNRPESVTKYKLLLDEVSEMSEVLKKFVELKQQANIELNYQWNLFIENAKK